MENNNCPFCGSEKVKLVKKSTLFGFNGLDDRIEYHTFSVRCNVCHARGPAYGGKVFCRCYPRIIHGMPDLKMPDWATTDEVLIRKAWDGWNRRTLL